MEADYSAQIGKFSHVSHVFMTAGYRYKSAIG